VFHLDYLGRVQLPELVLLPLLPIPREQGHLRNAVIKVEPRDTCAEEDSLCCPDVK
jgi:hypothetical protein